MFAYAPVVGVSSIGWFFVVLGFLLDLGSLFGGGREGTAAAGSADGSTCWERPWKRATT